MQNTVIIPRENSISKILKNSKVSDYKDNINSFFTISNEITNDSKTTGSTLTESAEVRTSPKKKMSDDLKKIKIKYLKGKSSENNTKTCYLSPCPVPNLPERNHKRRVSAVTEDAEKLAAANV